GINHHPHDFKRKGSASRRVGVPDSRPPRTRLKARRTRTPRGDLAASDMGNRYSPRAMNGLIEPEGQTIVDSSGENIGKVEEIYLDLRTGNWDWALVRAGQFGDRPHLVP